MTKPKIRSGTRRSSMRPRGYGSSCEQAFWYPSGMEIHCEVNGMCPPPMANYSPFPHNVRLSCMPPDVPQTCGGTSGCCGVPTFGTNLNY